MNGERYKIFYVTTGLDPVVHDAAAPWIAGSSPAMTEKE